MAGGSTRALVTGATGWLGSRLVRGLCEGLPGAPGVAAAEQPLEVRCLKSPHDRAPAPNVAPVRVCPGDLRDPPSLDRFCGDAEGAVLYHCAGVIHPRLRTREFVEVNVEGTRHLLAAAEAHGVRRAVVMSSNSPMGTNPDRAHRFDEESPYNPYMGYGRSKMLMESVVREFQARGRLETVIVRAPWFYGPGQPIRQTTFFTMIRTGSAPIVGDGNNLRSMTYVDNLCCGLLLCARTPAASGEVFWIADARPYTMNEIVDTVERLLASEFGMAVSGTRRRLPSVVSEIARVVDGATQRAGLYFQKIHVLSEMNKTIACRIDKARRLLGYEPHVALEDGMRRSIRWCVDNGITL